MTKPVRSPILGYNHNIQFHGRVFHVQTEDSGAQHARLFTHLFFEGTILASKKHEYEGDTPEDAVRLLMQRLHKAMIKELKEGVHDARIKAFFAARGETITFGDRPSLVQAPAADAPPAVVSRPAQPIPAVDDRPAAISGSIDTPTQPAPAVGGTPGPEVKQPAPARKPVVVVKPPDVKRPPVQVNGSAEGVVVKRNVVINVGGGAAPVQGQISRGTAVPRPAVPYVVREGSYPLPTVSRGSGPHQNPPKEAPPAETGPVPSTRDIRMPWDAPRGRGPSDHTPTGRAVGPDAGLRTRTPAAAGSDKLERTPAERAFSSDLPSDKSLDEVILEYLSDDVE